MIKGKTKSGFTFEIDPEELNDMEFLEALAETSENPLAFPKVCAMLLGKEQKQRLYEHLRNENGKVPIEAVEKEITEIMSSSGEEIKNC